MKIHACILAVALGAVACGGSDRADRDNDSTAASNSENGKGQSVTLAGCLQQGDGREYILTQVNTPTGAVGTTGSSSENANEPASPNAVGQQQLRAAAHSYRLSGDDDHVRDQMRDLVGHQVRVQGTIADKSDLSHDNAGTADEPADIKEDDLAKVDVTSVQSTGPACGAERK